MVDIRIVVTSLFLLLAVEAGYTIATSSGSEVHDIAVTNVTVFPTRVLSSSTVTINATIENQGTIYETFNVTAYFDNRTIQTVTVTDMAPGLNTTLTFTWLVYPHRFHICAEWPVQLEPADENVTIKVEADVVPSEMDISDNTYIDGIVTVVWMVVDYDGNGIIDIRDIAAAARVFGSEPGHPRWDPAVDFDQNEIVDIRDIAAVARMFGKVYA